MQSFVPVRTALATQPRAGLTRTCTREKKHMLDSFRDEKSIKYPSPLIQAALIFQMINDGLTKQALDKC